MKTWSIRKKLLLAFAIVTFFAATSGIAGIFGLYTLSMNQVIMHEIAQSSSVGAQLAKNVQEQYSAFRGASINFYLGFDVQDDVAKISELNDEFYELLAAQERKIPPEEKIAVQLMAEARDVYTNEYIPLLNSLLQAIQNGDVAAMQQLLPQMEQPLNKVSETMDVFTTAAIELIETTSSEDGFIANVLIIALSILVAITVIAAAKLAFESSGKISRRAGFMKDMLFQMGKQGVVDLTEEQYRQAEKFNAEEQDEIGESISMLIETGNRLHDISVVIEAVANGDLTAELDVLSPQDKIGMNVKKMLDNLNEMFNDIGSSTSNVAAGSRQVSNGAQVLAQGASEQTAAVDQLGLSISKVRDKILQNTEMAEKAAHLADKIKLNAQRGSNQMDEMISAVEDINQASHSVNKVIKVIDEIAFQTDILALNAAIEAARAGTHGLGFAVVAGEVRNLAAKSADAAKYTETLIADSMVKTELGTRIAKETASSLLEIVSGINTSNEIVTDIAKSSNEQSTDIDQINDGISRVSQVIQQNNSAAQQSAAASQQMSGQADTLNQLILQFKVRERRGSYDTLHLPSA